LLCKAGEKLSTALYDILPVVLAGKTMDACVICYDHQEGEHITKSCFKKRVLQAGLAQLGMPLAHELDTRKV